ncbi:hypothetical protein JOQ06_003446, partial [Pogonophryne albipinna]
HGAVPTGCTVPSTPLPAPETHRHYGRQPQIKATSPSLCHGARWGTDARKESTLLQQFDDMKQINSFIKTRFVHG